MEPNIEEQEIIKEYFKMQAETPIKLCIYEKHLEWFYANCQWNYITIQKKRFENEWIEHYVLKSKRFHTFNKKATIQPMSFEYFMAQDYMQEYFHVTSETCDAIQNYMSEFLEFRNQDPHYTLKMFRNFKIEKREKEKQGCFEGIFWVITIILALFVATIPLAIFTCPWTWKLIDKITKKEKQKDEKHIINTPDCID